MAFNENSKWPPSDPSHPPLSIHTNLGRNKGWYQGVPTPTVGRLLDGYSRHPV